MTPKYHDTERAVMERSPGSPKTLKQFSWGREEPAPGDGKEQRCSEALCGVEMNVPAGGSGIREVQNAL